MAAVGIGKGTADVHCSISEHQFNQDFQIENPEQWYEMKDSVQSKTESFLSGNIELRVALKKFTEESNSRYAGFNGGQQNGGPAVLQLCGLVNKGEACFIGIKFEVLSPYNSYFRKQNYYNLSSQNNSTKNYKKLFNGKYQVIEEIQSDYLDSINHQFNYGRQQTRNILTVRASGTILIPCVSKEGIATVEELRKTGLPQELSSLLRTPKYSDIDISVGGKNFSVHKNILWSRSKGFAHLLQEMESRNGNHPVNILTVNGFSPEVVQEALKYMYTGVVPNIRSLASDLLVFSEAYKISGLKILCESEIESSIATGNACEYADLADRLNAVQLRSYCVDFIKKNVKLIVGTEKWNQFKKKNPDLAMDIVEPLAVRS